MNRNLTVVAFQFGMVFLFLAILFFAAGVTPKTSGCTGPLLREIIAIFKDDATQWMLVVCLLVYLGIFLFWEFRAWQGVGLKTGQAGARAKSPLLLGALAHSAFMLVILCLVGYAGNYPSSARSLQMLTLLAGIVVGKACAMCVNFSSSADEIKRSRAFHRLTVVLTMIVGLLTIAALYQPNSGPAYAYHDIRRWTGPWDNPNLFGLLMGTGAVLAAGLGLGRCGMEDGRSRMANKIWKGKFSKSLLILLCLTAVILLGRGLYHSFSRGAWLGTAVGMAFLVAKSEIGHRKPEMFCHVSWIKQNRLPLFAIALSVFVVGFWQLRFSKLQSAQRIASVANPNDFSWRNRLDAWQGAARMMIDKPLTGFGWGEAESIYAKLYCTTAPDESAAIEMNDYLMLGISGGVPVMLCFIGYVALALTGKSERWITQKLGTDEAHSKPRSNRGDDAQTSGICENMEPPNVGCYSLKGISCESHASVSPSSILYLPSSVYLTTTCRAGAIVLLVGFWFDGGLFKLPAAVVFWTLLELSRLGFVVPQTASAKVANERLRAHHDGAHGVTRPTFGNCHHRWLSRAAWCAVMVAVGVTSFYLFAPYLPVSDKTIAIARHYLILSKERDDFDFLADKPIWHGQKLKTLLDQAELAHYNRALINWKLDEKIYRNYVLSPIIEPALNTNFPSLNLNWRRSLWEAFYPLIRHENSLADAAQIVVRHLRERVTIADLPNPSRSVSAIWRRQVTDENGFQILYVAALRSVGVPARLDTDGQAEFYDGQHWQPAPKPVVD
jgi:hypothetical protein